MEAARAVSILSRNKENRMRQYKKYYELKNAAKDKLDGK